MTSSSRSSSSRSPARSPIISIWSISLIMLSVKRSKACDCWEISSSSLPSISSLTGPSSTGKAALSSSVGWFSSNKSSIEISGLSSSSSSTGLSIGTAAISSSDSSSSSMSDCGSISGSGSGAGACSASSNASISSISKSSSAALSARISSMSSPDTSSFSSVL